MLISCQNGAIRRLPQILLLTISATALLSHNAFAQEFEQSKVKQWSKEELFAPAPKEASNNLFLGVGKQLVKVLGDMSRQTDEHQKLLDRYNEQKELRQNWITHFAVDGVRPGDNFANDEHISKHVQTVAQKSAQNVVKSTESYKQLVSYFRFELDLSKSNKNKISAEKQLRYGLVLQDIKVSEIGRNQASTSSNWQEDMKYAGQSDFVWTIGPVEEKKQRLFNVTNDTGVKRESQSFWQNISLPDPRFGVAANIDFAKLTQQNEDGQPQFNVSIDQKQGLYSMIVSSDQSASNDEAFVHKFKLPLAKKMHASRSYDRHFGAMESRLNHILLEEHSPRVDIIYADKDRKFKTEASMTFGRHAVGVGTSCAQDNCSDTPFEQADISYATSF